MNPIPFAGCFNPNPGFAQSARLVFVGLPDDSQSAFMKGPAEAPRVIRASYDGRCYNSCSESGADLAGRVADLGDLPSAAGWAQTYKTYRDFARRLFAESRIPFFAGGDHAVTIPIVEALDALGEPIHVVQLDAHPDLYDQFEGDRLSHACTGARILEMEHVASLTQLGVRTLNAAQSEVAARHRDRLRMFVATDIGRDPLRLRHLPPDAKVYLSVDMDAFDPAFAPGLSHPVPGGLDPRQLLDLLQNAPWHLVGMDAVEVNPSRDTNNQTAILAARLLHEGMGRSLAEPRQTEPQAKCGDT